MLHRWRSIRMRSLVLLAYGLIVVAGLCSPAIGAGDIQVLCLGNGGMKMVMIADDGTAEPVEGQSTMACLLCQTSAPPPAFVAWPPRPVDPLERATRPMVEAHLAAATGAPLPPRGPPAV